MLLLFDWRTNKHYTDPQTFLASKSGFHRTAEKAEMLRISKRGNRCLQKLFRFANASDPYDIGKAASRHLHCRWNFSGRCPHVPSWLLLSAGHAATSNLGLVCRCPSIVVFVADICHVHPRVSHFVDRANRHIQPTGLDSIYLAVVLSYQDVT